MTRHADPRINRLLRDWGLRGDLEATKAAYEAPDFDALMLFFQDAHRGHGIKNFSQRMQHVFHAKTGEILTIDLADTLKNLYYLRPDAGEIRYVAAASRYTYGRHANSAWFERMKAMELEDIHSFLDVRKAPVPNRSCIHVLINCLRDGIDPQYVGGLPLHPADTGGGFKHGEIVELWDADIPAGYASALRTHYPSDAETSSFSVDGIKKLYEAGVPADYAAALNRRRPVRDVLRFYSEGIAAEFALEL